MFAVAAGFWDEQEGVSPVRLVTVQDVFRAPTPDVIRLPAAGRSGRPQTQAARLGSRVLVVSGGWALASGWDRHERARSCKH